MYSLPSNVCVLVAQSCLTLCNPMYCSPPGTSAHGILWVRILEWVAIPFIVMYKDSSFSISSSALTILHHFYYSHPSRYEVASHCEFDLHFPND